MPSPFLAFFLMRLKLVRSLGSIFASRSFALSLSSSSSSLVSCIISLSSFFLSTRSASRSERRVFVFSSSSDLSCTLMVASFIFLLHSSISRVWNSISLLSMSYSLLFLTSLSCCLYFSRLACAFAISPFLLTIAFWNSLTSSSIFSIRVLRPSISSSRSCTSRGSSPLRALLPSIAESVVCN